MLSACKNAGFLPTMSRLEKGLGISCPSQGSLKGTSLHSCLMPCRVTKGREIEHIHVVMRDVMKLLYRIFHFTLPKKLVKTLLKRALSLSFACDNRYGPVVLLVLAWSSYHVTPLFLQPLFHTLCLALRTMSLRGISL